MEQLDDHCRLTAGGINWWIVAVRDGRYIGLTSEHGKSVVDVADVDWDRYAAAAVEMIEEKENGHDQQRIAPSNRRRDRE